MKAFRYVAALVVALGLSIGISVAFAQSRATGPQTWEYMLIEWTKMGEEGFNRLGAQGWELVAVDTETRSIGYENTAGGSREVGSETYFYFKRPR